MANKYWIANNPNSQVSDAEAQKIEELSATNVSLAELNANCDVLTEAVTTTNVIAASETGTHFVLNSATAFVSTLPALAAGLEQYKVI